MIQRRSLWSRIDRFLAAMLLTVALASLLPARGDAAVAVGWLTPAAIALLFFMHGAQLSPAAALLGARQWRLHTMVFLSTFVLFPLLGTAVHRLVPGLLTPPLWAGLIARINSTKARTVGFINPTLYATPTALRDITLGNNGDFAAAPGWDACTGLGSPDGLKIASLFGASPTA